MFSVVRIRDATLTAAAEALLRSLRAAVRTWA
jgi:hypothetical protein